MLLGAFGLTYSPGKPSIADDSVSQSTSHAHGTGSYPPVQKGWQRKRRFVPNQIPDSTPYLATAWYVYSEHEGVNLQLGGSAGEMKR